jgi:endonuclease YncB( thermonuclease family)
VYCASEKYFAIAHAGTQYILTEGCNDVYFKENKMRALILVYCCLFNTAHAEVFTAKIIVVIDGDTVLVRRASGLVKIRLAEIDAPEKVQTFGETSKQSLASMVLGKQVNIKTQTIDKYGRLVAHISINGLDVNAEQIRRGMAWEYSNFHSNKALKNLQQEAKDAPRGLWARSNPVPPWEWRKQHPNTWPGQTQPSVPTASTPSATSTRVPDPTCGNKTQCSEMVSCAEAMQYFTACGIHTLDGNHNGVPCEKLCPDKLAR